MEIIEVSAKEYGEIIKSPYFVFGSAAFNELNKIKCDKVFYLLFREGKYRLGISGGLMNNIFCSPFSSPYGGFLYLSSDVKIQYLEEAVKLLDQWAVENGIGSLRIIPPPPVFDGSFIAKQVNCLWRAGYNISELNLNYSLNLALMTDKYMESIWHNARKNLKISLNSGLTFVKCDDINEKKVAYDVIAKNRERRGNPLRMPWEEILKTCGLISADFFLVYANSLPAAAAIVFDINPACVRVIYWGDMEGFSEFKVMNFLSFRIFDYYKSIGKSIVELGIATEHSVPNYGLSEFKEGIGCNVEPTMIFVKKIN